MFGRKKKEENKFIELLIRQSAKTEDGIKVLLELVEHPDEDSLQQLRAVEQEADEIRRIIIDELHNTFITPIDREDIFNLSLYIDDMIDYGLTTLEEMVLLKVDADDYLRKMIGLVAQQAGELNMAAQRLISNQRVAGDHARRTKKLESEVDRLYRLAVAELFSNANDIKSLPALFKRREVYRHVSNMSDRADTAANIFGMVVMKLS